MQIILGLLFLLVTFALFSSGAAWWVWILAYLAMALVARFIGGQPR
jgi:hypothetical protein